MIKSYREYDRENIVLIMFGILDMCKRLFCNFI